MTQNEWQPIESAPKDGTLIQVEIPGNGSDNVVYWMSGLLDSDDKDCGGWTFAHWEQEPPDCWTDGICWDVNEDNVPSVQPTRWKQLTDATP